MKDSMRNIKRVAEDGTGPLNKRPHRQGKPLRKRAERVALPDGRFRFGDDQWREIELFGFPPDARRRLETYVSMYRNGLVDSLNALPPAKTRQNLQRLAIAARKFCGEFQRVTDDVRAWDLIRDLRDWPLNRLDNWEQGLIDLPEALTEAANAVQLGPPGAAADWNLLGFVNTLAPLWEEYTATLFDRSKRRPNAADFIIAVGLIADPQVHSSTWENVLRSVAAKRFWEN